MTNLDVSASARRSELSIPGVCAASALRRVGRWLGTRADARCLADERTAVSAEELGVPVHLLQLLLLVEDKRFWWHQGIDFLGVFRAVGMRALGRGRVQGASTIPEQLLKSPERQQRLWRERILRAYASLGNRDHVAELNAYLGCVYLGRGAYGLFEGSMVYFQKHVMSLERAEAFFLVDRIALPNALRIARIRNMLARPAVYETVRSELDSLCPIYMRHFGDKAACIDELVREMRAPDER